MISTEALLKVLRRLQANPSLCRAVAVEVTRLREAAQNEALTKAATAAVSQLGEKLDGIERAIAAVKKSDERRRVLTAMNAAAWHNGALHFDPDRFEAAMGGNDDITA